MQPHPLPLKRMPTSPHNLGNSFIKRIRKPHVSHDPALKKCKRPHALRPVDNLVRHHKVARLDLFLQGAHGAEGDDAAHAEGPEGSDVRPAGYFVRGERVVDAVPGEEGDGDGVVCEDGDGGGGGAPGGSDCEGGDGREAFKVLEAGAADDGYVDRSWGEKVSVFGVPGFMFTLRKWRI